MGSTIAPYRKTRAGALPRFPSGEPALLRDHKDVLPKRCAKSLTEARPSLIQQTRVSGRTQYWGNLDCNWRLNAIIDSPFEIRRQGPGDHIICDMIGGIFINTYYPAL